MTTEAEAREISAAIEQFKSADIATREQEITDRVAVAQAWWDSIKPVVPTTRLEALAAYKFIETEIITQRTNHNNETVEVQKLVFRDRVNMLNKKLLEADEKYKERKLNK